MNLAGATNVTSAAEQQSNVAAPRSGAEMCIISLRLLCTQEVVCAHNIWYGVFGPSSPGCERSTRNTDDTSYVPLRPTTCSSTIDCSSTYVPTRAMPEAHALDAYTAPRLRARRDHEKTDRETIGNIQGIVAYLSRKVSRKIRQ